MTTLSFKELKHALTDAQKENLDEVILPLRQRELLDAIGKEIMPLIVKTCDRGDETSLTDMSFLLAHMTSNMLQNTLVLVPKVDAFRLIQMHYQLLLLAFDANGIEIE